MPLALAPIDPLGAANQRGARALGGFDAVERLPHGLVANGVNVEVKAFASIFEAL